MSVYEAGLLIMGGEAKKRERDEAKRLWGAILRGAEAVN